VPVIFVILGQTDTCSLFAKTLDQKL